MAGIPRDPAFSILIGIGGTEHARAHPIDQRGWFSDRRNIILTASDRSQTRSCGTVDSEPSGAVEVIVLKHCTGN